MSSPSITIDLDIIEANARTVVNACGERGIGVFGVTKGTCGMPAVAHAMLRGGVTGLAESRFENIRRLRASGITAPILLLRSPPPTALEELVATVDISLNSELAVLRNISSTALRLGRIHEVILMVDMGDLREGIWRDDLLAVAEQVVQLTGVRIVGLGTNLNCFGAIVPDERNMAELVAHAYTLERAFDLKLRYVSGGNSGSLPLMLRGGMPSGVNHLRIGEAILQGGRDSFLDKPWEALNPNAFRLSGTLIELKTKPSVPVGQAGVDAFGNRPQFEDKGDRLRGILNIGREDVVVGDLRPVDAGVEVLGASSDHLVLDVTDKSPLPAVGDSIAFSLHYGAMLAAMTSEYVEKRPLLQSRRSAVDTPTLQLHIAPGTHAAVSGFGWADKLAALGMGVSEQEASMQDLTPGSSLYLSPDRAQSLPALQALIPQGLRVGCLWFDASAQLDTAPDGEQTLYRALGHGAAPDSCLNALSPENLVLIGLREVSDAEVLRLKAARIKVFTMADIDALGIREVMRLALLHARAGTDGLHVAYNPSVSDLPGYEAGTGGLTVRETHVAMEMLAHTRQLLSLEVSSLDALCAERTLAHCLHFVLSALGKKIL